MITTTEGVHKVKSVLKIEEKYIVWVKILGQKS